MGGQCTRAFWRGWADSVALDMALGAFPGLGTVVIDPDGPSARKVFSIVVGEIEDVVVRIARIRREPLQLVGRCGGGRSTDAWHVTSDSGDFVLKIASPGAVKWFTRVSRMVDSLRDRGCPAPEHFVYSLPTATAMLQTWMPGEVAPPLNANLANHVIALNELQRGAAPKMAHEWRDDLRAMLLPGSWTGVDALAAWSSAGASFVARARELGESVDWSALRVDDVTHFDLHPGNIMSADGTSVSGIIDWDGARAGDHLYDLVHFAYTAAGTRDEGALRALWDAVFALDSESRTAACIACVGISVTGWILAHSGVDAARWALRAGEAALAYLEAGRFTHFPQ